MGPWPWYVAGPAIGLLVPLLLLIGGKRFGISANLRHMCAALPTRSSFLRYDWKRMGLWNLVFAGGVMVGGFVAVTFLGGGGPVDISADTVRTLEGMGTSDFSGTVPAELISWRGLGTVSGFLMVVGGGVLIGFGARYAGGCTSGHAITGLADLQGPSLVAVLGFFAGGLLVSHVILPFLIGG